MKSKSRGQIGAAFPAGRDLFTSLDVMVGFNSHEGCFFVGPVASLEGEPDNFTPNRTFYENTLVPRPLELAFHKKSSKLLRNLILQVYINWDYPNDALLIRESFVNLYTDIIFAETILDYVKNHHRLSSANKTYLYAFDVLRNTDFFSSPSWCTRDTRGDELHFEFFEEANGLTNLIHGFENYVSEDWERNLAKVIADDAMDELRKNRVRVTVLFLFARMISLSVVDKNAETTKSRQDHSNGILCFVRNTIK